MAPVSVALLLARVLEAAATAAVRHLEGPGAGAPPLEPRDLDAYVEPGRDRAVDDQELRARPPFGFAP